MKKLLLKKTVLYKMIKLRKGDKSNEWGRKNIKWIL